MGKIDIRQKKQKEMFVQQLTKTPIIQLVCEKLNIGRTTYYRWVRGDKKFAQACEKSLSEGYATINDMAEGTLLSLMKDGNLSACIYWLKNHHSSYKNKLEVSGKLNVRNDELTKEQEKDIKRALKLMLITNNKTKQLTRKEKHDQEK